MKSIMQIGVPYRLGNFYSLSNLKMSQGKHAAVDLASYSPKHHGYGKQLAIRRATAL